MSGNQWYQQTQPEYPRSQQRAYPSPNTTTTAGTVQTRQPPVQAQQGVDSVHDARRLLASYPLASATPTSHVSRHLGALSLTATPPTYYIQPTAYSLQYAPVSRQQQQYDHYNEYGTELAHLAAPTQPYGDGGYWERTRNEAVRYLGEQPSYSRNYGQWETHSQYGNSPYQTTPFAQSVFQQTAPPSTAYPTPPPPGISSSSSSLAFALGRPPPKPAPKPYRVEESKQYFNDFLTKQTSALNGNVPINGSRAVPPPAQAVLQQNARVSSSTNATPQKAVKYRESPDPLALTPVTPTSRKRKAAQALDSPTVKRAQSNPPQVVPKVEDSVKPLVAAQQIEKETSATLKKPIRMQAFVELPPVPKIYQSQTQTPTSQKTVRYSSHTPSQKSLGKRKAGDDGVTGSIGTGEYSERSPTKRATGDRDDRGPLEKFETLLEDILEAEDTLPNDMDVADLASEFFSSHTVDPSAPLLHPTMIRKLTSHITKVARPTKRARQSTKDSASGWTDTPRAKLGIADLDSATLGRVLRILERSVKAGEDVDPFDAHRTAELRAGTVEPRSPVKKRKKAERRSKSKTPFTEEADKDAEAEIERQSETPAPGELSAADLDSVARVLEVARDSVYAADCCIALLSSDRLNKQLYSEELITSCLAAVKNQLTRIVYPFVEAAADVYGQTPPLLRRIVAPGAVMPECATIRQELGKIFHAVTAIFPRVTDLVCADAMAMSEGIIIQAVYIAIGPFFVVDGSVDGRGKERKDSVVLNTLGSSAMRGLRLDALSLIRGIFANHEDQRSWIIEEVMSSLIKLSDTKQKAGQFRLRDGRSINTVSALLLQLVQTSAHDVRVQARTIRKARLQDMTLRRQDSMNDQEEQPFLDEKDMEELRLYSSGLDAATKAAKTIVAFLTQRSGKTKATKNANEAEYRAILDNLVGDVLTVLFWPDWPAASVLLSVAIKFMVSSLDDVKTAAQNENNAAKTMALDHLGVIAARLRTNALKYQTPDNFGLPLQSLDEATASYDLDALTSLISAHRDLFSYLARRSGDDQAYDTARELNAVMWGQELAAALKHTASLLEDDDDEATAKLDKKAHAFGSKLKDALAEVWTDTDNDVFDTNNQQEDAVRVDRLGERLGSVQILKSYFNPILNVVIQALEAPAVFMRTKALRALGQIVTSDPSILSTPNVRRAIETHVVDHSAAVRDAAVELIGKYMIDSPGFASDYYQRVADRIADTGLGVRKRVIKLLKAFYSVTPDMDKKVDICHRMVLRMFDEDDTVKVVAVKTMEELWFLDASAHGQKAADKSQLTAKVVVIMGVAAQFKDKQSPLEELLHKAMMDKDTSSATTLHQKYSEICETLIDGLVDASDLPGFTVINCVRTIYLFTAAYPAVVSVTHASTLLPYLKNATSPEEQATTDYLLRIFRACLPNLPKTALKFGQELQASLQLMILKPSPGAGVTGLQETVACMCAVVQHLTHDYKKLVMLLKSCSLRLQQLLAKPASGKAGAVDVRTVSILILIAALLCEHFDFETLRTQDDLRNDLDSITKGPLTAHIYQLFLKLYEKNTDAHVRSRILQCLGFLFRAQPSLLTADSSSHIMDEIFNSDDDDAKGRLLKIMQEFLVSEAEKHTVVEKEKASSKSKSLDPNVDMEQLVGNTDQFADSGVSSVIVQRYLHFVLKAALCQHTHMQAAAVDILSFTIKQGLAHPLQCFPVIVALETSSNASFSTRASSLHAILHNKHTSLLNSRYVHSARASYNYQKTISKGAVRGYCVSETSPEPTALLHHWYSLVREKRPSRQEFLKALVKVFDIEIGKTSDDDLNFVRYMAENFASFDYKTQEEVLTVLKYLTSILSTAGSQVVEALSPSHLLAQLHDNGPKLNALPFVEGQMPVELAPGTPAPELDYGTLGPMAKSSVVVCIIMLLKSHLKVLYGISEEKCSKWVIGKKTAVGDRAATRRHQKGLVWDRLSFATNPILSTQDAVLQRQQFLAVWSEDGCTAEPEDEFV